MKKQKLNSYQRKLRNRYNKLMNGNSTRKQREAYLNECLKSAEATILAHGGNYVKSEKELTDAQIKFMDEEHPELDVHSFIGDTNGYIVYGINIETQQVSPYILHDNADKN